MAIGQRVCPLCHGAGAVDESDPTANRIGRWNREGQSTQRLAALENYPRSGSQRERVLSFVLAYGEATVDEMERVLEMTHQSCSARVNDLLNGGWIVDTGRTRRTRSGAQAAIWAPSDAAMAWKCDRPTKETT